jgi:hypothetical protein
MRVGLYGLRHNSDADSLGNCARAPQKISPPPTYIISNTVCSLSTPLFQVPGEKFGARFSITNIVREPIELGVGPTKEVLWGFESRRILLRFCETCGGIGTRQRNKAKIKSPERPFSNIYDYQSFRYHEFQRSKGRCSRALREEVDRIRGTSSNWPYNVPEILNIKTLELWMDREIDEHWEQRLI